MTHSCHKPPTVDIYKSRAIHALSLRNNKLEEQLHHLGTLNNLDVELPINLIESIFERHRRARCLDCLEFCDSIDSASNSRLAALWCYRFNFLRSFTGNAALT
jgi:hypothetical protein